MFRFISPAFLAEAGAATMMRSQISLEHGPWLGLAQILAEPAAEAGVGEHLLQRVGRQRLDRVEGRVGVKRVGALQREIE
jgi:hypothetical protein